MRIHIIIHTHTACLLYSSSRWETLRWDQLVVIIKTVSNDQFSASLSLEEGLTAINCNFFFFFLQISGATVSQRPSGLPMGHQTSSPSLTTGGSTWIMVGWITWSSHDCHVIETDTLSCRWWVGEGGWDPCRSEGKQEFLWNQRLPHRSCRP